MESQGNQPASPETDAAKRRNDHRELVLAYKRALATADGRRILADLCAKFGFDPQEHENSAYTFGISGMDLSWREGTKDPVRHLLKMRDLVLKPLGEKPARRRAKSGLAPGP